MHFRCQRLADYWKEGTHQFYSDILRPQPDQILTITSSDYSCLAMSNNYLVEETRNEEQNSHSYETQTHLFLIYKKN